MVRHLDGYCILIRHNLECRVGPATSKGENYSSEVSRCDMTVVADGEEKRELHWICKTLPEIPFFPKTIMRDMRMEEKEISFYTKVYSQFGSANFPPRGCVNPAS